MLKPLTKTDYRQLFCAALRSGKYEQVEGENWCDNKVCALGVGVREGLFEDNRDLDIFTRCANNLNGAPSSFYEDASRKLDLNICQVEAIYSMNDEKVPFEDIAVWIEAQP